MDYSKWDNAVNAEEFKDYEESLTELSSDDFDKEVDRGNYTVEIVDIGLGESKKGKIMLNVEFKIIGGDFNNWHLWYGQVLDSNYPLHKGMEFLRSLDALEELEFKNFKQLEEDIETIKKNIKKYKLSYNLKYDEKKGYKTYTIEEVFEG